MSYDYSSIKIEPIRDARVIDLTGQQFSQLTVIGYAGGSDWWCRCECGKITRPASQSLRMGRTTGCGCAKSERQSRNATTHGLRKHPLYKAWAQMRRRCEKPSDSCYANYGGRGIKVCPEWDSFPIFLRDMGEKPSVTHSIERKDNNGDYCPENCYWATRLEQNHNRRNTVYLTFQGKTLPLPEWATLIGIHYTTLSARLRKGWNVESALTTPLRAQRS